MIGGSCRSSEGGLLALSVNWAEKNDSVQRILGQLSVDGNTSKHEPLTLHTEKTLLSHHPETLTNHRLQIGGGQVHTHYSLSIS